MMSFEPVMAEIVRERPDGSGVVRVPLAGVTLGGDREITREMLGQVVRNFGTFGPVPVSASPHPEDPFGDRAGPADGFVDAIELRGDRLWGTLDLGPSLFGSVRERRWRGFSVELRRDLNIGTRKWDGWVLVGGVFTNRPAAAGTEMKIAAEAMVAAEAMDCFSPLKEQAEEMGMADEKSVSLATHEAKVGELNAAIAVKAEKVSALESSNTALYAEVTALRKQVAEMGEKVLTAENDRSVFSAAAVRLEAQHKTATRDKETLTAKVAELEAKLAERDKADTTEKVRRICAEAVAAGVLPALFEGHEDDPAAWLGSKFASLEAFEGHVKVLRGVASGKGSGSVKSGHDSAKANDPTLIELSADEQSIFKRLKLNPALAAVTDEETAREAYEASRAAKK